MLSGTSAISMAFIVKLHIPQSVKTAYNIFSHYFRHNPGKPTETMEIPKPSKIGNKTTRHMKYGSEFSMEKPVKKNAAYLETYLLTCMPKCISKAMPFPQQWIRQEI
jgi:hypothetical protein